MKNYFKQLFVLLVSLLAFSFQSSGLDFPNTPAGKRAKEIFNLFNNKSDLTPKEHMKQNCTEEFKNAIPEDQWGAPIVQIRNMTRDVDLAAVEKDEKYEIIFIIQSKTNTMRFKIDVKVEEKESNKISFMRFMPANQQGNNIQQQQGQQKVDVSQEKIQQVKDFLYQQAEMGRFSGAALVAKDGKSLLVESAGLANKRFNVSNRPDTKFNLGSLNKSFTSVAILQLVEAGKIGIDDPIGKYLDIFPKEIADKVTIRQLLNMSSGWGDYWQNEYFLAHKDMLRNVSDYIKFIKDMPLQFEPGTNTIHSNTGFEVAGAIIEKVSGMDYFEYIRQKIYKPSDMINSETFDRDSPVNNLATGYTNNHNCDSLKTGFQWENTYILSPKGTPAGGGYSTVQDMLKYDMAIRSNKLIGKKYVDFMSNGYRGNIGDPFVHQRIAKGAGGAPGVSTFFSRDWNSGFTVVVLTNVDNPVGIEIGNQILKILGLE